MAESAAVLFGRLVSEDDDEEEDDFFGGILLLFMINKRNLPLDKQEYRKILLILKFVFPGVQICLFFVFIVNCKLQRFR